MRSGAIHDVISAIIYCLINAVDGCGDHAPTKPVGVSLCMGAGGQCTMEYSVPEFILDIYACLYQEVDLHVIMYSNVSVQLNSAPLPVSGDGHGDYNFKNICLSLN